MTTLVADSSLLATTVPTMRGARARGSQGSTRSPQALLEQRSQGSWATICAKLALWSSRPESLNDAEVDRPEPAAIRSALVIADALSLRTPAPIAVVPSGYGEIDFEWSRGTGSATLTIRTDGSAEYILFSGGKLIQRVSVDADDLVQV